MPLKLGVETGARGCKASKLNERRVPYSFHDGNDRNRVLILASPRAEGSCIARDLKQSIRETYLNGSIGAQRDTFYHDRS
jgi:hypothetical protein